MSTSPSRNDSDLQASIQQLIADTVRRAEAASSTELESLRALVRETLEAIEQQQQALGTMADRLRSALSEVATESEATPTPAAAPEAKDEPVFETPTVEVAAPDTEPVETPAEERGPHELDVIAHGATLTHASGLQTYLRGEAAAASVQTRQYVNGELRLNLSMLSGIDMPALQTWLASNGGSIVTTTDRVIEIAFT